MGDVAVSEADDELDDVVPERFREEPADDGANRSGERGTSEDADATHRVVLLLACTDHVHRAHRVRVNVPAAGGKPAQRAHDERLHNDLGQRVRDVLERHGMSLVTQAEWFRSRSGNVNQRYPEPRAQYGRNSCGLRESAVQRDLVAMLAS